MPMLQVWGKRSSVDPVPVYVLGKTLFDALSFIKIKIVT